MNENALVKPMTFLSGLLSRINSSDGVIPMIHKEEIAEGLSEALQELQLASEFDFREIGDHLYDGIYISDGSGKTIHVNKAYTRITGVRVEPVANGRYRHFVKGARRLFPVSGNK